MPRAPTAPAGRGAREPEAAKGAAAGASWVDPKLARRDLRGSGVLLRRSRWLRTASGQRAEREDRKPEAHGAQCNDSSRPAHWPRTAFRRPGHHDPPPSPRTNGARKPAHSSHCRREEMTTSTQGPPGVGSVLSKGLLTWRPRRPGGSPPRRVLRRRRAASTASITVSMVPAVRGVLDRGMDPRSLRSRSAIWACARECSSLPTWCSRLGVARR